jgi:hypothetical protein
MNPYYTHQQSLIDILNLFEYDTNVLNFLEFGSGEGSSPIFNEYAKKSENVNVQSFEHDLDWLNDMKSKYSLKNYTFKHVSWENFDYTQLKEHKYDLVFVDQGDWSARIRTIDELKYNSKYIILHDYCYYNGFRGSNIPDSDREWALSVEKNTFFHDKYADNFDIQTDTNLFPPTLILKNKFIK